MRALAATRKMRKPSVELIEGFPPFRIEGQSDYCTINIGPFPSFGWQQVDIYMG
jgi:hypothetical protein